MAIQDLIGEQGRYDVKEDEVARVARLLWDASSYGFCSFASQDHRYRVAEAVVTLLDKSKAHGM
jgi:hypothetical protein